MYSEHDAVVRKCHVLVTSIFFITYDYLIY